MAPRSRTAACVALLLLAVLLAGPGAGTAAAHAGLVRSERAAGAALGASPAAVSLTFGERPDASLSSIRVLDERGVARQAGRLAAAGDDGLLLTLRVLPRGVYTVTWRGVSAIDGHATLADTERERPRRQRAA